MTSERVKELAEIIANRRQTTVMETDEVAGILCEHARIHSFLAAMGYEGTTEKMVDQLAADAVARKAERDSAQAESVAWKQSCQRLAIERDEQRKRAVNALHDVAQLAEQRDAAEVQLAAEQALCLENAKAGHWLKGELEKARAELAAGTLLMQEQQRQRDDYKQAAAGLRTMLESAQFQLHASRAEVERLRTEREAVVSVIDLGRISVILEDDNRSADAKAIRSACHELVRLRKELTETESRLDLLDALEAAGVDNWPGYAVAQESLKDEA